MAPPEQVCFLQEAAAKVADQVNRASAYQVAGGEELSIQDKAHTESQAASEAAPVAVLAMALLFNLTTGQVVVVATQAEQVEATAEPVMVNTAAAEEAIILALSKQDQRAPIIAMAMSR